MFQKGAGLFEGKSGFVSGHRRMQRGSAGKIRIHVTCHM
jgi:hypothetical protein